MRKSEINLLPTLYPCSLAPMNLVLALRLILGTTLSAPSFDPRTWCCVRPEKRNFEPKCGKVALCAGSGCFSLQHHHGNSDVTMVVQRPVLNNTYACDTTSRRRSTISVVILMTDNVGRHCQSLVGTHDTLSAEK